MFAANRPPRLLSLDRRDPGRSREGSDRIPTVSRRVEARLNSAAPTVFRRLVFSVQTMATRTAGYWPAFERLPSADRAAASTRLVIGQASDGRDTSRLVGLDVAAHQIGCHVETLRIRVRTGHLKAVRGPHGAYYSKPQALSQPRGIRHVERPVAITAEARERSWAPVERGLDVEEVAALRAVRSDADRHWPLHPIVSVHRLLAVGMGFGQIASELGITPRHARRLARCDLRVALVTARRRWPSAAR